MSNEKSTIIKRLNPLSCNLIQSSNTITQAFEMVNEGLFGQLINEDLDVGKIHFCKYLQSEIDENRINICNLTLSGFNIDMILMNTKTPCKFIDFQKTASNYVIELILNGSYGNWYLLNQSDMLQQISGNNSYLETFIEDVATKSIDNIISKHNTSYSVEMHYANQFSNSGKITSLDDLKQILYNFKNSTQVKITPNTESAYNSSIYSSLTATSDNKYILTFRQNLSVEKFSGDSDFLRGNTEYIMDSTVKLFSNENVTSSQPSGTFFFSGLVNYNRNSSTSLGFIDTNYFIKGTVLGEFKVSTKTDDLVKIINYKPSSPQPIPIYKTKDFTRFIIQLKIPSSLAESVTDIDSSGVLISIEARGIAEVEEGGGNR